MAGSVLHREVPEWVPNPMPHSGPPWLTTPKQDMPTGDRLLLAAQTHTPACLVPQEKDRAEPVPHGEEELPGPTA